MDNTIDEKQIISQDTPYYQTSASEKKELENLTNILMYTSLEDLYKNYSHNQLFDMFMSDLPTIHSNVIGYLSVLKHLFVIDFILPENASNTSSNKKDQIIETIALANPNTDNTTLDGQLKAIDPVFSLPIGFVLNNFQIHAQELNNANFNIKNIIADYLMPEYVPDVAHFLTLSPADMHKTVEELETLSVKIEKEYDKMLRNENPSDLVITEAIDFLAKTGRTTMFVQSLRENKNLGDITELIIKINTALQIANLLKTEKPTETNISEDIIKDAIKTYLIKDINI